MKKRFLLSAIILFISVTVINAQNMGGGMQRQTVEQRVDTAMSRIAVLNLDAATTTKADSIFTTFYTAQQKAMQDMMTGGTVDRDAMRQKRQQLADDRDTQLKAIFTSDQYNKWKNDIEPSLRPQRGNRQSPQ